MDSEASEQDHAPVLQRIRELGQAVYGSPEKIEAVLPQLLALFKPNGNPEVLLAVVDALGNVWDEAVSEALLLLAVANHPDSRIRLAVARALPHGVQSQPLRTRVAAALISMTVDDQDDVRDWACFGLGQLEADGDEVRDALAARLDDPHSDTRCEALVALAKLGDPRSTCAVGGRLTADPDDITMLELRAAEELADPALLPALRALEELWSEDEDDHTSALRRAIHRCDPATAVRAERVERDIVAAANGRLAPKGICISMDGNFPRTVVRFACSGTALPKEEWRLWDDKDPVTLNVEREVERQVEEASRACSAAAD